MSIQAVLLPLFVQVTLTFILLLITGFARRADLLGGGVHPRDIALGQIGWRPRTQQFGNSFRNQFELPVLFYVLTILAIMTRQTDTIFVVLSWLFVLSRIAHVYVHVTNNHVFRRGMIFGVGGIILIIMWLIFMVRILAGASLP